MFHSRTNSGFTLIELLVTLSILGFITALAAPAINSWLASRSNDALRQELSANLALLPLKALSEGRSLRIETADELVDDPTNVTITSPIVVMHNGYCKGGEVATGLDTARRQYRVTAPFCRLSRVN